MAEAGAVNLDGRFEQRTRALVAAAWGAMYGAAAGGAFTVGVVALSLFDVVRSAEPPPGTLQYPDGIAEALGFGLLVLLVATLAGTLAGVVLGGANVLVAHRFGTTWPVAVVAGAAEGLLGAIILPLPIFGTAVPWQLAAGIAACGGVAAAAHLRHVRRLWLRSVSPPSWVPA